MTLSRTLALALALLAVPSVAHAGFKAKKASDAELVDCLTSQPKDVKRDCMDYIVDKEVMEAGPALAELAKTGGDRVLRAQALGTLEKLGAPEAVPTAVHMARQDTDRPNREKALVVLQKMADEAVGAPVVIEAMAEDPEEGVRRKALTVAKKVTWDGMEEAMIAHGLNDASAMVRRDAIYGLLAIDSELGRPAIYDATKGLPDAERTSVMRVWAKNPLPADRDFLVSMLDDPSEDVAIYAARTMVKTGDATLAPVLREKGKEYGGDRKDEFKDAAKELEKGG